MLVFLRQIVTKYDVRRCVPPVGINVTAFCMCGIPGETVSDMYATYDFKVRCGFDSASFFAATPMIGSELLEICRKNNYLNKNYSKVRNFLKLGNITTTEFKSAEVESLVKKFYRQYKKTIKG